MGIARPHISAKLEFAIEKQMVYQGHVLTVKPLSLAITRW